MDRSTSYARTAHHYEKLARERRLRQTEKHERVRNYVLARNERAEVRAARCAA